MLRVSIGIIQRIDVWALEPIAHGRQEVHDKIFAEEERVTNVGGGVGGGAYVFEVGCW